MTYSCFVQQISSQIEEFEFDLKKQAEHHSSYCPSKTECFSMAFCLMYPMHFFIFVFCPTPDNFTQQEDSLSCH